MATLAALESVLASCWGEDTCDPADDWDPANPSRGHCGVTAMAVLELLGGELLEAEVWTANGQRTGVHYWNRLPSGLEVDLTRQQFRQGETLTEPVVRVPNWNPNSRMASRQPVRQASPPTSGHRRPSGLPGGLVTPTITADTTHVVRTRRERCCCAEASDWGANARPRLRTGPRLILGRCDIQPRNPSMRAS